MSTNALPQSVLPAPAARREADARRATAARERLREAPDDTDALFELADAHARMGRHDDARSAHRALLRADGRYADLRAPVEKQCATSFIGQFDSVDCPVCGDHHANMVWVGNISGQVRTWGHLDPVREWVECTSCETLRVQAPPSEAALQRWHRARSHEHSPTSAPNLREFDAAMAERNHELDVLEQVGFGIAWLDDPDAHEPRLLEVGCGWGSLIAAARWRGISAAGVGTNAQTAWARATQDLPCVAADLDHGIRPEHLPDGSFDIIVLRSPLDRAEAPLAVLQAAARRLSPDGVLVLQLELHDHPVRRVQGYDAPGWSRPERRVFFGRDTLEVALARTHLRSERIQEVRDASSGTSLLFVRHDDLHDLMGAE